MSSSPNFTSTAPTTATGNAALPPTAPSLPGPDPGFTMFLKFWTLGVILSSIAYGIAFSLFAACLYLLRKSSIGYRKRVQYALCAYITSMFTLSTVSIVSGISTNLNAITSQQVPPNLVSGASSDAVVTILAFWASDGFLLWRASILYKGVSSNKRHLVYGIISLLATAQVVTGIMYLASNFVAAAQQHARPIFVAFASTTLSVNWIITTLVVTRLLVFRANVKRTLGNDHGRPYIGIISMCIESAALVIIFATIFLTLNLLNLDPFSFSRAFLVHIYVIAPLLTIYRVAQGKAFITDTSSFYTDSAGSSNIGPGQSSMHFNHNTSTAISATSPQRIEVNISHEEFRRGDALNDVEMGVKHTNQHKDGAL